jgi:4-hydroxybenzoate polyprenyltransferase
VLHKLKLYAELTRLHRPIGTLLLLWPTLWALWIAASGQPTLYFVFAFSLGTLLMRSAGCAINDWADRDFDRHVERTKNRPLTAGKIEPNEALWVFAVLCLLSGLLIFPMNRLTWGLAVIAVFLAASYPFTKRFLSIPQAYLGIAFGFGIPMAYAAVQGAVPETAWLLLLANIAWAIAYDTEYAMVDREDDLRIGIKTSAITFGRFDIAAILTCYALTLALLATVGVLEELGMYFYFGLIVALAISVHHYRLIKTRSRAGCFEAFLHNNWFGAAIFVGIALDYWLP